MECFHCNQKRKINQKENTEKIWEKSEGKNNKQRRYNQFPPNLLLHERTVRQTQTSTLSTS